MIKRRIQVVSSFIFVLHLMGKLVKNMLEILTRAGCFVAIILLGYILRRINYFKEQDFTVLSKIVLRITLPGAIVSSFAGKEINPAMLTLSLIGLGAGLVYIGLAIVLNPKADKEKTVFELVNLSGYNIGNFTMPFVQSFLGATGVIATSLFDVGNAFVCLGGSHAIGSSLKQGGRLSLTMIAKRLVKSIPFDCYVIMTVLCMLKISLPAAVISFAEIIGNANAFLAMLMIGVGFKLNGDRKQIGRIVRMLGIRYGVGLLLALGCYFLLPFSSEVRLALVILAFAPIPAAAPAYTEELKGDVGLASAVNSLSIVCSIIIIVSML